MIEDLMQMRMRIPNNRRCLKGKLQGCGLGASRLTSQSARLPAVRKLPSTVVSL
jgi:hypothetical protein